LPVLSDVHRESDVAEAAAVLDVVQVPAFLCQQTSLLEAVGRHARVVNIKKGQFLAPEAMAGPVDKVRAGGGRHILLTERGSCFGYGRLVSDPTSVPIMQSLGCPVIFDASHIVRRHGVPSASPEGGRPEHIPLLARAGVAAGADALFIETHPEPGRALCDAASMLPLAELAELARTALAIAACVRPAHRPVTR
jgi:2-dehydro-3-deoxyphosphooctonate aldolase (KDO 8-P synthase)